MSEVRRCPRATSVASHEPSTPTSEVRLLAPMPTPPPMSNALASDADADTDANADNTSDEARRRRPSLQRRLAHLVKGMRGVALSLTLFFGALLGILVWTSALSTSEFDGNEWKRWHFVVQIVATTSSLTMLMLLGRAANVVLYLYWKAVHGELAMEIAKEFSWEYVSLPFDDKKVPHVVSVAYA